MGTEKSFLGLGSDPDEQPQHEVTISEPFWISSTEVTKEQFQRFVLETGYQTKAEKQGWAQILTAYEPVSAIGTIEKKRGYYWKNVPRGGGERGPVSCVNWDDAVSFCKWLTKKERQAGRLPEGFEYTLPTEAQWEYACRAGTMEKHAGNLKSMAWYQSNSGGKTHPVGTKQPNAWGLYDMHGNVAEWCADRYGDYSPGSVADPTGPSSGSLRVIRGGAMAHGASQCRSAYRGNDSSGTSCLIGFRLALFHGENSEGRVALGVDKEDQAVDWGAATKRVRVSGASRMGGSPAAMVNGEIKRVGDIIKVDLEGRIYQWTLASISSDGEVQLERMGIETDVK